MPKVSLSAFSRSRRHQIRNVCYHLTTYMTHYQYRFMSPPVKCSFNKESLQRAFFSMEPKPGPENRFTETFHLSLLLLIVPYLLAAAMVLPRPDSQPCGELYLGCNPKMMIKGKIMENWKGTSRVLLRCLYHLLSVFCFL